MTAMNAIERACIAWDSAIDTEAVEPIPCNSGVAVGEIGASPRFAFVSFASPLEVLFAAAPTVAVSDRDGVSMSSTVLETRLLNGEVAAVLAPAAPISTAHRTTDGITLSDELRARRQELRANNVQVRFLLRQIGLAEVSSHRGAPAALYTKTAALWSRDLALCTDPAMLLTLGADRQRYVDADFNARAIDRLPRALGRLHTLGVRSYPRLVIV